MLPAGAKSYSLVIIYDQDIDPATFTATLNGINVKSLFHPVKNKNEEVKLNLIKGTNKLILSVKGKCPDNTKGTDTDTLLFVTQ